MVNSFIPWNGVGQSKEKTQNQSRIIYNLISFTHFIYNLIFIHILISSLRHLSLSVNTLCSLWSFQCWSYLQCGNLGKKKLVKKNWKRKWVIWDNIFSICFCLVLHPQFYLDLIEKLFPLMITWLDWHAH